MVTPKFGRSPPSSMPGSAKILPTSDYYSFIQTSSNKAYTHLTKFKMKRKVGALEKVEADLTNLQSKIKRDPRSYKDDFSNQYQQYQSFLTLFMQAPGSADEQGVVSLRDLIDFVSHVADCYPEITSDFPSDLITLLSQHHAELEPELREKVVGSLVLIRKKDIIDSST